MIKFKNYLNLMVLLFLSLSVVSCSRDNGKVHLKDFDRWNVYKIKTKSGEISAFKSIDSITKSEIIFLYSKENCNKPSTISIGIKNNFSNKINPGILAINFSNIIKNIKDGQKIQQKFVSNSYFFMGSLFKSPKNKKNGFLLIYKKNKVNDLLKKNTNYKYLNIGIVAGTESAKGHLYPSEYLNFPLKGFIKAENYASTVCNKIKKR